jgi:hypothetical protein
LSICATEFYKVCGALMLMHHIINLVQHTLSDALLNVCLWIASFLVVNSTPTPAGTFTVTSRS